MSDILRFDLFLCSAIAGISGYQLVKFDFNYLTLACIIHSCLYSIWVLSALVRAPRIWHKYNSRIVQNLFRFGCIQYVLTSTEEGLNLFLSYFHNESTNWSPALPNYSQDLNLFLVSAPILLAASVFRLYLSIPVHIG